MSAVHIHQGCRSILLIHCCHGFNNKTTPQTMFAAGVANRQPPTRGRGVCDALWGKIYFQCSRNSSVASKWFQAFLWFPTSVVLLAEMPIASGAAGRVDVGVDTSTTWTPDGMKRTPKPVNRNYDSYLLRCVRLLHLNRNINITQYFKIRLLHPCVALLLLYMSHRTDQFPWMWNLVIAGLCKWNISA